MFYAHFVLAKKGPLARIWLAAHWDKKLTKAHVFETNIEKSVDGILQPKVKMALRTSGHLLLGVVRIYSRKAKYLLADCNEAFVKIKMAFRPGMVDLPDDIREAAVSAITLPEVFHDFDSTMPELNDVDIQAQFTLNQSRAEEITMREDYGGHLSLGGGGGSGDDGFGDMGFEEPSDIMRDGSGLDHTSLGHPGLIFGDGTPMGVGRSDLSKDLRMRGDGLDLEAPIRDDGFGGHLGQDIMAGGLFEGGLFDDTPIGEGPVGGDLGGVKYGKGRGGDDDSDDDGADIFGGGPPSVNSSTDGGSRPNSPIGRLQTLAKTSVQAISSGLDFDHQEAGPSREGAEGIGAHDQTTLLQNEEESFALAPVDASALKAGWPRHKRKRKLIVDEVKNISGEEMKAQLSDTTDIVTTLDLAPPTKRLMHWKETGGVEKLFALPGRPINARTMGRVYQRHLTSQPAANEDFGMAGDKELEHLTLDQVREADLLHELDGGVVVPKMRGRPPKRRLEEGELGDPDVPHTRKSERLTSPRAVAPLLEPPVHQSAAQLEHTFNQLVADNTNPDEMPDHPIGDMSHHSSAFTNDQHPLNCPSMASPDGGPRSVYSEHAHTPLGGASPSRDDDDEEEQAEDETYEQYEERVVNKRAGQMFMGIKKVLRQKQISFMEMTQGNNRKQVAQKFYTMLVLKKLQAVELSQQGPFGEILVSRGGLFENASL